MARASLIDRPLTKSDDEALGLQDYADVMADFIRDCETPVTIGIQGDWGIGKTSFLNMLMEKLAPRPKQQYHYPCVYLNTWQYAQFDQAERLPLVMLRAVVEEIQRQAGRHWTDAAVEHAGWLLKAAGRALDHVVKEKAGIGISDLAAAGDGGDVAGDLSALLVGYKERFGKLVRSLCPDGKGHVVLMIDDLDRVAPVRALELLEAVKVFLDVPGCVFVLAVDYAVIQRGMQVKLGASAQELHGKSFFDKIIQVPFNMPVASYKVDRYILSLLGWEWADSGYRKSSGEHSFLNTRDKSVTDRDVEFFTNITRLTVGSNPRSIKRAVNYAGLLKRIVQRRRQRTSQKRSYWQMADARLLFPLACMQLAWPELFSWFADAPTPASVKRLEDWDFLGQLPEAQRVLRRAHNPEEVRSHITGFFDELINLIDTNGDGEIQPGEFRPIWRMMEEANLTSVDLEDVEESWSAFRRLAVEHAGGCEDEIDAVLRLFRDQASHWNSRVRFRLVPAGKKFFNVLWDGRQVGSLVTTRSNTIQLYLCRPHGWLSGQLSESTARLVIDVTGVGHYGAGDTQVKVWEMSRLDDGVGRSNEIHDALTAARPAA